MRTSLAGSRGCARGRREAGVTLLELLIVLSLLSLLLSLVAPRIGRSIDGWKLRSAAERVAQIAAYARARALFEQRYYLVEIDPTADRVRLLEPVSGFVREFTFPSDLRWEEEGNLAAQSRMRLIFPPSGAFEERTILLSNRRGNKMQVHLSFLFASPRVESAGGRF